MKARSVLAIVVIGACALVAVSRWAPRVGRLPGGAPGGRPRIVSLSPAITETLFALGVGDRVVGVSEYCDHPPEVLKIARVGAGTSPELEASARLAPTMILGEATLRLSEATLAPLAPAHLLPWLTASEIVHGVQRIGALVDRRPQAEELASRMERRLLVAPSANAPRVLMLLGDKPGRVGPIYFVKPGSLHDTLLTAAGARNAVEGPVRSAPALQHLPREVACFRLPQRKHWLKPGIGQELEPMAPDILEIQIAVPNVRDAIGSRRGRHRPRPVHVLLVAAPGREREHVERYADPLGLGSGLPPAARHA